LAASAVGTAAVPAAAVPAVATAAAASAESLPSDPFTLGVASGDPLPGALVLWTRLAPSPTAPDLGMAGQPPLAVEWAVATSADALDSTPVAVGTATAEPAFAWSVHVDVAGLRPDTAYWYRFRCGTWTSAVGRTHTTPVPSAHTAARFAVLSCQNLAKPGGGVFALNPLADLAARNEVDFVVHLGDYVYEFGRPGHVPPRPCTTLEDYRRRHGQYKSVAALQQLHAQVPVYVVPDDHDYFDNVAGRDPQMSVEQGARFDAAIQAYWENMPLRGGPPVRDAASGRLQLTFQRAVRWGRHLELLVVDDRQYRVPATSILGAAQRDWLLERVAGSHATWTAIGSGVPVAWFPDFAGAADKWTGFDADRSALTDALAGRLEQRAHRAFNPVVLSGDTHRGLVTHVRQRQDADSALVATEFVGPPVTSNSSADFDAEADRGAYRAQYAYTDGGLQSYRGYLRCTADADTWTTEYHLGDDVVHPGAPLTTVARWQLAAGAPVGAVRSV
jgi:alkaline phosphatase D